MLFQPVERRNIWLRHRYKTILCPVRQTLEAELDFETFLFLVLCYQKLHKFKLKLMTNCWGTLGGFDHCI